MNKLQCPRLAVIGHSHLPGFISAYNDAYAKGDTTFDLIAFEFFKRARPWMIIVEGEATFGPEVINEVRQFVTDNDPDYILLMLQGESAILNGLIAPDPPFDFYFPGEALNQLNVTGNIIPYDLLQNVFVDPELRLTIDFLELVLADFRIPSFAVSPPPPSADQTFVIDHILRYLSGYSYYEEVQTHGLAGSWWRGKIWNLFVHGMQAMYENRGIQFLEAPLATRDMNNCLLHGYSADAIHANELYYLHVLEQISVAIAQRTE